MFYKNETIYSNKLSSSVYTKENPAPKPASTANNYKVENQWAATNTNLHKNSCLLRECSLRISIHFSWLLFPWSRFKNLNIWLDMRLNGLRLRDMMLCWLGIPLKKASWLLCMSIYKSMVNNCVWIYKKWCRNLAVESHLWFKICWGAMMQEIK